MIPANFYRYKQTPLFTNENIPQKLQGLHSTAAGVYGKIQIVSGKILFTHFKDSGGEIESKKEYGAGESIILPPEDYHSVTPISSDMSLVVDFYQQKTPEMMKIDIPFKLKFKNKIPHEELVVLLSKIEEKKGKKALDLGCGLGRNSLLSAFLGYEVDSWDIMQERLDHIDEIAKTHNLIIFPSPKDLNTQRVEKNYDLIFSTVALQFLEKQSAFELLQSAIQHTNPGGYHMIVVPISSNDVSCSLKFKNYSPIQEYLTLYEKDFEILWSDDYVGRFHVKDKNGNGILSRFMCLMAKKK